MSVLPSSPFHHFLAKLTSHSALKQEEQHAILALPARPMQVQTNRDFVRLGECVSHSCLVVEGLVGRFGQNAEGGRQITALHIPGDMTDLHSVVAPEATSALQALTTTTIMQVAHADLHTIARRFPSISEAFWRECVLDAALLAEWVVNVGRRNARSRTAHLLCEMACRYGGVGEGSSFSFALPATQTHLGDVLALTPVHVNRMLKSLREDGVVDVGSRRVTVLDWEAMVTIGDFDPSYLHIGKSSNDNRCGVAAA
jgi:CRP-like cAMP-binding protein